jgi:hypothetical protein
MVVMMKVTQESDIALTTGLSRIQAPRTLLHPDPLFEAEMHQTPPTSTDLLIRAHQSSWKAA